VFMNVAFGQSDSNGLNVSFNVGIGNTDVRSFHNLYPIATPRVGYRFKSIMYGVETNRYQVKSAFRVRDLGLFARFYTSSKFVSFVETKINHGSIKFSSESRSTYYSLAVSPGWEWHAPRNENLSLYGMVDFYYRDRQLQDQMMNITPRFGVNYKL
jgi:hypothetical protein